MTDAIIRERQALNQRRVYCTNMGQHHFLCVYWPCQLGMVNDAMLALVKSTARQLKEEAKRCTG